MTNRAERALERLQRNIAARDSHPLAAALSDLFADESFALDVRDVEAEASFLIGAVPCPGWHDFQLVCDGFPCRECGAAV